LGFLDGIANTPKYYPHCDTTTAAFFSFSLYFALTLTLMYIENDFHSFTKKGVW